MFSGFGPNSYSFSLRYSSESDLSRISLASSLLTTLLKLLKSNENSQGIKIFIGQESGIFTLDECSVVTSSYDVDGTIVGSLGVIGPTRMSYDRVIPIVDITAKLLSSSLSQQ